jgi:hypothetical protein
MKITAGNEKMRQGEKERDFRDGGENGDPYPMNCRDKKVFVWSKRKKIKKQSKIEMGNGTVSAHSA